MALSGLGLFLLEACAGTAFLLLFFPPTVLGKGFFSLHGALAAIFARPGAAGEAGGAAARHAVAATGLLAVYTLRRTGAGRAPARPLLAGGSGLRGLEPGPRGPGGAARRGQRVDGRRRDGRAGSSSARSS